MARVYRSYEEMDVEKLEGYMISSVSTGVNAEDTGMHIELEREIEGGVIGIDIVYDPDSDECKETPLMISGEYIKHVFDK